MLLTAHKYFIFKCCPKCTIWLRERFLDLASDPRHGPDICAFELCYLESSGEHVLYKGCVLEDFERYARQLEFLDDLCRPVDVQYNACRRYAEGCSVSTERVESAEAGVGKRDRAVKRSVAMHMFWCVFEHTHADGMVVERVDGDRLESSPTETENEGIVGLESEDGEGRGEEDGEEKGRAQRGYAYGGNQEQERGRQRGGRGKETA